MTLLLDIDGVLIGHHPIISPEESGFSDWVQAGKGKPFVRWTSAEQLALIKSTFDDIQWHTTWIGHMKKETPGVNLFAEWFDFGPGNQE